MFPTLPPSPAAILRDPAQWPFIGAVAIKSKPPGAVSVADLRPFFTGLTLAQLNWIQHGGLATVGNVAIFTAEVRFERAAGGGVDDAGATVRGIILTFPGADDDFILGGVTFDPVTVPPGGAVRTLIHFITLTGGGQ